MREIDHLRDVYFAVGQFLADGPNSEEWFEALRRKYSETSIFYWSSKHASSYK